METTNPQAYDALLLGLEHLHRDTEADTMKAISLFEKAVALDPDYSRAYAAVAAAQLRIALSILVHDGGRRDWIAHYNATRESREGHGESDVARLSTVAAVWASANRQI